MGRELICNVRWGDATSSGKVLLESTELIVRGPLRRRVPISALEGVSVQGDDLAFRVDGSPVSLHMGASAAEKWARAIAKPAPTLPAKLGISLTTHLLAVGEGLVPEVQAAIAEAGSVNGGDANLALICVSSPADLEAGIAQIKSLPVWIVYPKGPGRPVNESLVRQSLRERGYIDIKVASVSTELVALRFQKRK